MTVHIPPEWEAYIDSKVANGEFTSRDDFIASVMRIYRELEERHEALRTDVQHAAAQINDGNHDDIESDEQLSMYFNTIKKDARMRHVSG